MEKNPKEILILIGLRVVGKGDTWKLLDEEIEYSSLTDTLEAYFSKTGEACNFRLEPLNSTLYAIKIVPEDETPLPLKKYNIYGDLE